MKKKTIVLLVVSSILSLAAFQDGLAGTLQDVKARGRLIVGVRTDLPPFGFVDKKGANRGFDINIAEALAKALFGKENAVEFVPTTRTNGIGLLEAKKIDALLGGMIITESHNEDMDFSVPYFTSGHLILARDDSTITRYQDLAGKKVATIAGSTGDIAIGQLVPQAQRLAFNGYPEALRDLKKKRVAALVDTAMIIIHLERRNPKLKIAGFQSFWPVSYGMGLRKGDEGWLESVNTTLTNMKETGEYQKLSEEWFAEAMAWLIGLERPMSREKVKK